MAKKRTILTETTKMLKDIKTMRDYTSQIVEVMQTSDELTPQMQTELEKIKNNFSKIFFEYHSSYQECIVEAIDGVLSDEFAPELQREYFQDFLDELYEVLTFFKEEQPARTRTLEEKPFVDENIQLYEEIKLMAAYMLDLINVLKLSNVIEMQQQLLIIGAKFNKEVFQFLPAYKSVINTFMNTTGTAKLLASKESLLHLFQDALDDLNQTLKLFDEDAVARAKSESTKKKN